MPNNFCKIFCFSASFIICIFFFQEFLQNFQGFEEYFIWFFAFCKISLKSFFSSFTVILIFWKFEKFFRIFEIRKILTKDLQSFCRISMHEIFRIFCFSIFLPVWFTASLRISTESPSSCRKLFRFCKMSKNFGLAENRKNEEFCENF